MRAHEDEMSYPIRHRLYIAQAGECCYCGHVMLCVGDVSKRKFATMYRLTLRQVEKRIMSLEHLQRKVDGGGSGRHNVALACMGCNTHRQETPWNAYKSQRMREPSITKMEASAQPTEQF